MSWKRILRISRPRFWSYEAGTFLVGCAAAYASSPPTTTPLWVIAGFFAYFLFPANLYIYGINDIFDYETDKLNPKKVEYEALVTPDEHKRLWRAIAITTLPFLILLVWANSSAAIALCAFFFFAAFYSAPPIRAKAIPGLDSIFSAGHYVATGVFAYLLLGGSHLSLLAIGAGMAWAIAMHAYSAVPDIAADKESGVPTIATALGKHKTILLCGALYALAAILSFVYLSFVSVVFGVIYLTLMGVSYRTSSDDALFSLYKYFPTINLIGGMVVFFRVFLA